MSAIFFQERPAVATPAGSPAHTARGVRELGQDQPQVKLAEHIGVDQSPARTKDRLRSKIRQRDLERLLVRAVLVWVQDLLGRVGRITEDLVDARVATGLVDLADEVEPVAVREQQLLAQKKRRREQLRVGAALAELIDLVLGHLLLSPEALHERRVAFGQRLDRE